MFRDSPETKRKREKAKRIYDEILECYKLPGCLETSSKFEQEIPEGENLLKL
jgi:hypothetical protein